MKTKQNVQNNEKNTSMEAVLRIHDNSVIDLQDTIKKTKTKNFLLITF
jgi:hypothetical protein